MVSAYDRHHGIGEANSFQNFRSHDGVNLHLLELFRRQPAGFRNDMFGHRQLANVVQQRGGMQGFQFAALHAQLLGYLDGVDANPLQVIVSGLVFGFNGQRQGLNGSQMQVRNLFHMPLLVLQLGQIQAVGTVDKVNGGDEQQRSLPVKRMIKPADHTRDTGSKQVIRERPEIAIHQNLTKRFPFAERNHNRNASGVDDEVGRSCQTQNQRAADNEFVNQSVVIDDIAQSGRKRARTNIERQLDGGGPVWVKTLGQHGDRAQSNRLRVAQLRNPHQDE